MVVPSAFENMSEGIFQRLICICGIPKDKHGYGCWNMTNEQKDMVNHPDHYGGKDNPYEHIKVVEAWGLDYWTGNATKYIARAGKKDPSKEIEDLRKAIFYLQDKVNRLEKKQCHHDSEE